MPSTMAFLAVSITVMPGSASTVRAVPSGSMKVIFTIGAKTPRLKAWARRPHTTCGGARGESQDWTARVNGLGAQIQARPRPVLGSGRKHLVNLVAGGRRCLGDHANRQLARCRTRSARRTTPHALGQFGQALQLPGTDSRGGAFKRVRGPLPVAVRGRPAQGFQIAGRLRRKKLKHFPRQGFVAERKTRKIGAVDRSCRRYARPSAPRLQGP